MKIATLTFHRALNYGAVLQCFALQKTIKDLGYDSDVLDYDCKIISREYRLVKTETYFKFIKSLILFPYYYQRKRNYDNFIKKYISKSCKYSYQDLRRVEDDYDVIITGSDQVWNYKLTGCDDAYFLGFISNRKKRLSYAASFGVKEIPKEFYEFYCKNIEGMGHISVRERAGAELVEQLCGRQADVVLDPVFLQTEDCWRNVMSNIKETGYVFVYMPGKYTIRVAQELANRKKLKLIHCAYDISFKNINDNVSDSRLSLGPDDFLSLLAGAEYVVSGSFHATAFSLIFQKKFFVEIPPNTGERINNLLNVFGLQNRIFNGDCLPDDREIKWQNVLEKMEVLRNKSLSCLKASIKAAVHD
ncbi:polysaccharide pyruvyl transferase family protein [Selenomonas ruminantium]|uniref:polysaccharide pyruvyl transferase family protein n=1 Tax=Selenomonas ruminantium TaxID=971 RepID=UPI00040DDF31|nr:polysaccharide pyruvyl transferase family protein [Selenomonas ruminantium]